MSQISTSCVLFKRLGAQICYFLAVPLFFFAFMLLYTPFDSGVFLGTGRGLFAFNVTILSTILLVFLICTRLTFYLIWRKRSVSLPLFTGWCVAEMICVSFFMALYIFLMNGRGMPYFTVLGRCLCLSLAVSVFPYSILTLVLLLLSSESASESEDDSLIRFHDSSQRLKLVIAASSVIFISAEENYVRIHYLEGGRMKDYSLRNSMKTIEEIVGRFGLVRSHRSYIVNPEHVKLLRKDKEGQIIADFDVETSPVFVSKKYYDRLESLLI